MNILTVTQLEAGKFYKVVDRGDDADDAFDGCVVMGTTFIAVCAVTIWLDPRRCNHPQSWIGAPWRDTDTEAKFVEIYPPILSNHLLTEYLDLVE